METQETSDRFENVKRKIDCASTTTGLTFEMNKNRELGERVDVNDLPVEMLEATLRNVATSDLISCRKVNRQWNIISSQIIHQRADIQVTFSFQNGQFMCSSHPMSLSDLIGCLEQSEHFPISSFRFIDLVVGRRDDFDRFLSIWGKNIKNIVVHITHANTLNNAEMLRVLLEATPNLKKLGIDFSAAWIMQEDKSTVPLFSASNKFELRQLNEFRVHAALDPFSVIVEDILAAAPNLTFFEKCVLEYGTLLEPLTTKELTILHSMNNLHCLKNVSFTFREDIVACLEVAPQIVDQPFESISLPIDMLMDGDDELNARATILLNKMFHASRNSLRLLDIPPLGGLNGLVLPKFENVQKLIMTHDEEQQDEDVVYCMFPLEFDMAGSFPNLRQLSVYFFGEDEYFSEYEPVNVMPKVEYLNMVFDDRYDEDLMKMTPNVRTLSVTNLSDAPPSLNFHDISIYLPKLETLKWETYGKSQHDLQSSCELDALITGYSKTFCKVKSVEFRDREYLSEREIASYEPYRLYSSLVDLKGLRRFHIIFNLERDSYSNDCRQDNNDDHERCDSAGFSRYSYWYQGPLTKVCQFFAFNLMHDLTTEVELRIE